MKMSFYTFDPVRKLEEDEDEGIDITADYIASIDVQEIVENIPADFREIFSFNISIKAEDSIFIMPWDSMFVKTNIHLKNQHAKCYDIVKEECAVSGAMRRGYH